MQQRVPAPATGHRLFRRYPTQLAFILLACLFGWAIWIGVFLSGGTGGGNLPLGPIVAAFIVASCQGRDELRSLGAPAPNWRARPEVVPGRSARADALHVLIVLVNHRLGAPLPTSDQLAGWPQVPVIFVVLLVLIGIGEEAGWTAFAAPILLRRHSLSSPGLLASAMRILWHLPLMLSGDLPWAVGIAGNAAFTMVTLLLLRRQWWLLDPGGRLARDAQRRGQLVLVHDGERQRRRPG